MYHNTRLNKDYFTADNYAKATTIETNLNILKIAFDCQTV
jgi:hypothetical protein